MRLRITFIVLVLVLTGCTASSGVTLDCDPDSVVQSAFDPDLSVPGFDEPRDALAILSWSRGIATLESESESEVVFVFVEDGLRVGAAFVVPATSGWLVSSLWTCPES